MGQRAKVALFLIAAVAILVAFNVLYQAANTLNQLDVVERERDAWQRPSDVISELNLRPGSTVADLGCGSGYFALKLSSSVGGDGKVTAIDIRRLSLTFLWIRSVLRGAHNISIVHGEPDNPHLPSTLDAVLIVNTYHELSAPEAILNGVRQSLVPGGRLVVVDHGTEEKESGSLHEKAASEVESELVHAGFEIMRREDRFIVQPNAGWWWLIVAYPSGLVRPSEPR
jgi:ubiquinone/menaquinone biosynthesis C-methylase UbiE